MKWTTISIQGLLMFAMPALNVMTGDLKEHHDMRAVGVRTGQERQKGPENFHHVATVGCEKCDAEYVISHKRKPKNGTVAAEQAAQLKAILSEDHRQKDKREHPDLVEF
jgi:hypothetical protein